MKKKDVIGIDVSKLTIDAYIKLAQVHAVFRNNREKNTSFFINHLFRTIYNLQF